MKSLLIFLQIVLVSFFSTAQEDTIGKLFRNSYRVWELQRNEIGIYRDSKLFHGDDYHPCSVANVGIGLISLCIADSMNWDEGALEKAILTLKTITGHTPGFKPDRNASGFYRHFIDMNTGVQYWNSEYSTIDTEILVAGALFAKNYFHNDSISKYALELWNSIDHEEAIADAENGKIFLTMESNGEGTSAKLTSVYNEYMIVAWMAKNAVSDVNSPAHKLWNKFYADPDNLPVSEYGGNKVLTDREGYFLSSFTHQFNYFLCHYFTTSEKYINYFKQTQKADLEWWKNSTPSENWEWGCGAGTGPDGYRADKINDNEKHVISPQIVAGFLPIFPEGKTDLQNMWKSKKSSYVFSDSQADTLLWRYSLKEANWNATEIQGIDYSTLLFGLASLPENLGMSFFERNNNFFEPLTNISIRQNNNGVRISLVNNPVHDTLVFKVVERVDGTVNLEVLNTQQQVVKEYANMQLYMGEFKSVSVSGLKAGIYFLQISKAGKRWATKKFVKY